MRPAEYMCTPIVRFWSRAAGNESRYSASTREASDLNGRRGVAQQVFAAPLPGM